MSVIYTERSPDSSPYLQQTIAIRPIIKELTKNILEGINNPDMVLEETAHLSRIVVGITQLFHNEVPTNFSYDKETNTYSYDHYFSSLNQIEVPKDDKNVLENITPEIAFKGILSALQRSFVTMKPFGSVQTIFEAKISETITLRMQLLPNEHQQGTKQPLHPDSKDAIQFIFSVATKAAPEKPVILKIKKHRHKRGVRGAEKAAEVRQGELFNALLSEMPPIDPVSNP